MSLEFEFVDELFDGAGVEPGADGVGVVDAFGG